MQPGDIMEYRMRHKLSCQELADLLGVHKSQVTRWETKHQKIPRWIENYFLLIEFSGKPIPEIRRIIKERASRPCPQTEA